jgi:hypothetical protein
MKRVGWPLTVVAAVLVTLAAVANAQEQKKLPRIGYLTTGDAASESIRAPLSASKDLRTKSPAAKSKCYISYERGDT